MPRLSWPTILPWTSRLRFCESPIDPPADRRSRFVLGSACRDKRRDRESRESSQRFSIASVLENDLTKSYVRRADWLAASPTPKIRSSRT
ncbi:hypothetical protein X777_02356 [Ooceraea biroi]|uniref:Uncharacterized protein n=1 Tax=Ooceraea biroi TaxID=2015173 RepID=A0A026WNR5_OOCBI|nr:hypothetical protein X777_02356 [Ooceraea biroi]